MVCELKCPRYWTLKTVLLTMEKHFSAPDSLELALFEGPHVLSHMLLESLTLKDVRAALRGNPPAPGKAPPQAIKVDLKQVKPWVRDSEVTQSILERIRGSTQFFSIMESLLSVASPPNQAKILKVLAFVGENEYFRKFIAEKLGQINVSPELLLCKENPAQALMHLHYSRSNGSHLLLATRALLRKQVGGAQRRAEH